LKKISSPLWYYGARLELGKTSIAMVIANTTKARFLRFSAVTSGIKEIKEVLEDAEVQFNMGRRTAIFVDEIHHFNKTQQDAFLLMWRREL